MGECRGGGRALWFGGCRGGLTCSATTSYRVDWRVPGFVSLITMLPLSADGSAPSILVERGMGSPLWQEWHPWLVSVRASEVPLSRFHFPPLLLLGGFVRQLGSGGVFKFMLVSVIGL